MFFLDKYFPNSTPHQRGLLQSQQQILGYQRPKEPYSVRKGGPLGQGAEETELKHSIRWSKDNDRRKLVGAANEQEKVNSRENTLSVDFS